jgi:tetratricopeptide (TPR) repeat protein
MNISELTLYFGPVALEFLIEVMLMNDEYDKALEKTEELIRQFESGAVRLFLPDLWHKKGQALQGLGRQAEAYQALLSAYELAKAQVSRRSLWEILSDLAAVSPDAQAAETYRKEGQEVVDYITDHIRDPQLRASFLNLPAVRRLTGSPIS